MKDFLEYLKEQSIVAILSNIYNKDLDSKNKKESFKNIISILEIINDGEGSSNVDLIGKIYEENLNYTDRKVLGEFYTPIPVVNYILDVIGYSQENPIEKNKLIDLSCGSGSFIIRAIEILILRFKYLYKIEKFSELTLENAISIIMKIKENIYGIDINHIACVLCQINIHFALFEIYKIIKEYNSAYKLPNFNIYNENALNFTNNKSFDFVVGNPPYLFIRNIPKEHRNIIEKSELKTIHGQYDYYQILLEKGINLLTEGGKLGYIIPDSILALSNRSIIREYIYNMTKIKEIYYTGPKFDDPIVSNIILILQKEIFKKKREKNLITIKIGNNKNEIVQKTLEEWNYKFLINLKEEDHFIINKLSKNFPTLEDLIDLSEFKILLGRGVEIGKDGKVIYCDTCKKYLPLPRSELRCKSCYNLLDKNTIEGIVVDLIPNNFKDQFCKFIYAINRYRIKDSKFIKKGLAGINYKENNIYEDRIIIRQLSQDNLICAAYEKGLSMTSQSYYNLKIVESSIPEFNNFYLLGVLNSQLISYYFMKSFGSYKKLFPRILIEKIKNLPIKIPKTTNDKKIAIEIMENVKSLVNSSSLVGYIRNNIQKDIDKSVFNLYNINAKNQEYILNYMNNL